MAWEAQGAPKDSTVVISADGVELACIMQEQVIHGLEHCKGDELKEELILTYSDILEDLNIYKFS